MTDEEKFKQAMKEAEEISPEDLQAGADMYDKLTEEEEARRGEALAEVLNLKKIRGGHDAGRYPTTWGTKTALGLYRTTRRIITNDKEAER